MRVWSVLVPVVAVSAACGSQSDDSSLSAVTFHAETAALPDVKADTGLQPAGAPVQLQLTVSADAQSTVDAVAYASGSKETPVLTSKMGSGKLSLNGGFGLHARLVVNIKGLPSYDGPVPGIENSKIAFDGTTNFDPFLLDGQLAAVTASIPSVNLPDIPLPGGIPGSLKIQVAEGSSVSNELRGTCASIDGSVAQYTGTLAHSGSLRLLPTIEIDVPLAGKKAYPLPEVKLPISVAAKAIDLGSQEVTFGTSPPDGNRATSRRCDGKTENRADAGSDASTTDANPTNDGGTTDGSTTTPGTAAECTARAKGNRDVYSACCDENKAGADEFVAIINAAICSSSACLSACSSSFCSNGGTSASAACHDCIQSSSTQASVKAALAAKCTSETCTRFNACYVAAP